eukprot:TRINITY_DN10436_c0_g1_i10.p1 TRINITY_DN10436_c0_g1~~TRINITY_DN10436_c0_g1_i10.p1  ORF type:complete len:394 (+),score=90.09 TRINITY_DN10436_c0_g1_i10:1723-2904(+)
MTPQVSEHPRTATFARNTLLSPMKKLVNNVKEQWREWSLPDNWFVNLFGFAETPNAVRTHLSVHGELLRSSVNGKTYQVGTFSTPSLGALRRDTDLFDPKLAGSLRLSHVFGDASLFQAAPENRHSVFQVASQFNCLEFISPSKIPEMGVTNYEEDRTQGPCCSVSCGPATVYRNYFVPMTRMYEGKELTQQGQSFDLQINNLDDVQELLGDSYFEVRSGYCAANNSSLSALNKILNEGGEQFAEAVMERLKVGLHSDVQVTSSMWGQNQVEDPEQIITQVFGSACSVSYTNASVETWAPFAKLVLQASYECCFLITLQNAKRLQFKNSSNVLHLTLLGGGVFGNRIEWILEAISKSCHKFKSTNLDVRIISYGRAYEKEINAMVKECNSSSL